MGISAAVYAAVRSTARRSYTGSAGQQIDMNRGGDLLVAQGLPPGTSLVSMGNSWVTQLLTANAGTPLTAIPTSASTIDLQLYNSAPLGSGTCVVIDSCFFICQTSEAAADFYSLVGQIVGPGVAAAPTAHASIVSSLDGKGVTYNGVVTRGTAVTTSTTNGWFAVGNTVSSLALTATKGLMMDFECFGRYVIPPTASFFLQSLASVAANSKIVVGARWHEVTLDLG